MNVSSLLDELDEMIDSAWNMPLSGGKALVDAERVREIVDKIRSSLPQEIRQAKAIVSDRSQIIADAKREAETVVRVAEERARVMVNQDEIVRQAQQKAADGEVLRSGDLEIYVDKHRVYVKGQEISLTNREFELLVFLAKHPGLVFSRDRLFERVWGLDAEGDTATVMVHINRIREKIEPDPAKPIYIETVWGAGYRFKE